MLKTFVYHTRLTWISFGRLRGNRDQYCELFLRETWGRELNFKKSPAGPGGPRLLTVKIGLEVGAFSLICQMFAVFRGSDCVISTLVLRVQFCGSACSLYILMFSCYYYFFFCSAYVIRLSDRCSRFLDPALNASPLKISAHLQWIFTIMITACLE